MAAERAFDALYNESVMVLRLRLLNPMSRLVATPQGMHFWLQG